MSRRLDVEDSRHRVAYEQAVKLLLIANVGTALDRTILETVRQGGFAISDLSKIPSGWMIDAYDAATHHIGLAIFAIGAKAKVKKAQAAIIDVDKAVKLAETAGLAAGARIVGRGNAAKAKQQVTIARAVAGIPPNLN